MSLTKRITILAALAAMTAAMSGCLPEGRSTRSSPAHTGRGTWP
jgi:hypothetical protein